MADVRYTDLAPLVAALADADILSMVDVSDTSANPAGTQFKLRMDTLAAYVNAKAAVQSVFTRTGAVVAEVGDYAAFYKPIGANSGGEWEDGTQAAPGARFNSQTDLGLYRAAAGDIGVVSGNVRLGGFFGSGIYAGAGAVGAGLLARDSSTGPAFAFVGDLDTGLRRISADLLSLTTGNVNALQAAATQVTANVTFSGPIIRGDEFAFNAAIMDGLFRPVSNRLELRVGGGSNGTAASVGYVSSVGSVIAWTAAQSAAAVDMPMLFGDPAAGTASHTWSGDIDTGMRRVSADRIALLAGGTDIVDVQSGKVTVPDDTALVGPKLTGYSLGTNTQDISGATVNIDVTTTGNAQDLNMTSQVTTLNFNNPPGGATVASPVLVKIRNKTVGPLNFPTITGIDWGNATAPTVIVAGSSTMFTLNTMDNGTNWQAALVGDGYAA